MPKIDHDSALVDQARLTFGSLAATQLRALLAARSLHRNGNPGGKPLAHFQRAMSVEPRGARLVREREEAKRTRGFAVSIDYLDGYPADARLIPHSMHLSIEKAVLTEGENGDRRRFGLVQWEGEATPPKSGLPRYVGDAFFADHRTAEFVWQAVIEKIENDAAGL